MTSAGTAAGTADPGLGVYILDGDENEPDWLKDGPPGMWKSIR